MDILLQKAVAGLLEYANHLIDAQVFQRGDDRQTADQLRDQAKFDQIVRDQILQCFALGDFLFAADFRAKTEGGRIGPLFDNPFNPLKCAAADKEDITGIDLDHLLLRMFAAALGRYVGDRSFQNFQKCLLNTLTADVTGDRSVFGFTGDFVNFVNIDNTVFGSFYIKICRLQQTNQHIFDVIANIAGFGQCRCVCNRKRNIQDLRQSLCQQRLTDTSRSQKENIALLQFYILVLIGALMQNPLIMVINRDRQRNLGLILANNILVQHSFNLSWLEQCDVLISSYRFIPRVGNRREKPLLRQHLITKRDTLVADICIPRMQHPADTVVPFPAKAAPNGILAVISHKSLLPDLS